ncbi:50S ribosomal protein L13 [Candidatus Woesearchaeota archaeon]|nr:50S ribosomal protein L13 [Candidatus Woesearchaeota archaeon]
MIINAENLILGRMAAAVAKQALLGDKIDIINSEKAVITGKPHAIIEHYRVKFQKGYALSGPYFPKHPERIVRRTIRGMLPHKQEKGRKAFKNVKCYIGIPKDFEGKKYDTIERANVKNIKKAKYLTIKEISKQLGWKE